MAKQNELTQSRANLLTSNAFGKDVLHQAIVRGDESEFQEIIKKVRESNVSLENKDYLSWAVQYRRYSFIAPLITSGCIPYLSNGHDISVLDYAIKSRDRRLLVDIVNACQRVPHIMSSDLMGDKRLLVKPFSKMTGKERIISLIMIVGMDFDSLSFYATEIRPIIAYSVYNDVPLKNLSSMTSHEHVREIINSELSSRG